MLGADGSGQGRTAGRTSEASGPVAVAGPPVGVAVEVAVEVLGGCFEATGPHGFKLN